MPPICATCRWYDRVDDRHGRCADTPMVNTGEAGDGKPPRIELAVTAADSRCSNWDTAHPTSRQRLTRTISAHLARR